MAVTVNDIGSVSFGEHDEWGNTVETYLSDVGQLTFYVPSGGTTFNAAWARNSNVIIQPGVY